MLATIVRDALLGQVQILPAYGGIGFWLASPSMREASTLLWEWTVVVDVTNVTNMYNETLSRDTCWSMSLLSCRSKDVVVGKDGGRLDRTTNTIAKHLLVRHCARTKMWIIQRPLCWDPILSKTNYCCNAQRCPGRRLPGHL
mmetsp:Transcript_23553/g.49314  ORF Transcript_23553/g.49314 Transcript_23553/m.49314 type:complete len:142 (+) Transcript_23553:331-756(+)